MIAPRISRLVAALVLTASVDLLAQQQEPLVQPGDRVRVTAPDVFGGALVGSVVTLTTDTCVLEVEGSTRLMNPRRVLVAGAPLTLPLASVTSLEVSRGRKSNIARGAGIGLLAGGSAGAIYGGLACAGDQCEASAGTAAAIAGAFGAGIGLFIGTAVGAATSGERWEAVPLNNIRVTLMPIGPSGLGATVRVRWSP